MKIIYKSAMKGMEAEDKKVFYNEKVAEYNQSLMNSNTAVEEGYVDEVLQPSETRDRLYQDLFALKNKQEFTIQKKHGNIPL